MDKVARSKLKHDKFAEEAWHSIEFLSEHRSEAYRYSAIAAVVLVIVGAVYGYVRWQRSARQDALRSAMTVQEGFVGENPPPGATVFKTQQEKEAAAIKTFTGLATKYPGSEEAMIARFYTATLLCDQGKIAEGEKTFQEVANGGSREYSALANLSLANLYSAQGKNAEAEKLLRTLAERPTVMVSKEQATLNLAKVIARRDPAEARKMLEALQAGNPDRPAVQRAAVAALGEMMGVR